MAFRLNSQQLFLTYPQCELDKQKALNILTDKLKEKKVEVENYIVAREKHKDGNLHLHVYLKLNKKVNIRHADFFDLPKENEDSVYHGNYQGCRSKGAVINYVKKDNDFISNLEEKELGIVQNAYQKAVETVKNGGEIESAINELMNDKRGSRDVVLHYEAIEKSLSKFAPKETFEETNLTLEDFGWEDGYWDKKTTLILYGLTNTGKTTLAKLLLPNAYFVGHMDDLKNVKGNQWKNGLIFDDMTFVHMFDEAQIHLLDFDNDRTIHCRFVNARIPKGTLKIITSNKDPDGIVCMSNGAIRRRVTVARIPKRGEIEFPDMWH